MNLETNRQGESWCQINSQSSGFGQMVSEDSTYTVK